jgi:hypothetical protein
VRSAGGGRLRSKNAACGVQVPHDFRHSLEGRLKNIINFKSIRRLVDTHVVHVVPLARPLGGRCHRTGRTRDEIRVEICPDFTDQAHFCRQSYGG